MKTIDIYEIGEEVLIRAKVSDIIVENGEVKYRIKAEHSNNDLDHKFTDHQLIPYEGPKAEEDKEDEDEPKDYIEEAERNWKKNREERRQVLS